MGRPKKNVVQLSDAEVKRLKALRKKQGTSQTIADRCNILLAVDENHLPAKTYDQCMVSCGVSRATIASTVKTTGEAGGLYRPYKGLLPASAIRALKT